mgnify:CR=1 FL=1
MSESQVMAVGIFIAVLGSPLNILANMAGLISMETSANIFFGSFGMLLIGRLLWKMRWRA